MDTKLENLIRELEKSSDPLTARELAAALHISVRSVHNYIDTINAAQPDTIASSRIGYTVNPGQAGKLLDHPPSFVAPNS